LLTWGSDMPSVVTGLIRRAVLAVAALSVLVVSGCGEVPEDATAKRSDMQAEQLRERLLRGQGAT